MILPFWGNIGEVAVRIFSAAVGYSWLQINTA
jgi:hypothetical protein